MFNTIDEALADLKSGKIVIVVDDENRENEGDFIVLAEKATPQAINFMATHGRGLICTAITEDRAQKLNLHPMVDVNTDPHGTAFTVSVDHKTNATGISAFERSITVTSLIAEDSVAGRFQTSWSYFSAYCKIWWGITTVWTYRGCGRFSQIMWSCTSWCNM